MSNNGWLWGLCALALGCQLEPEGVAFVEESGTTTAAEPATTTGGGIESLGTSASSSGVESAAGTTSGGSSGGSSSDGGFLFDLGSDVDVGEPRPSCAVGNDGLDAPVACTDEAPADSFTPDVQWIWEGTEELRQVVTTPLVANLTDDNGDGSIDLCDTPDIVVVAYAFGAQVAPGQRGTMFVLDGATGAPHFSMPTDVSITTSPALGDIDGDGLPEIIATRAPEGAGAFDVPQHLVAFNHDGTVLFETEDSFPTYFATVGLADLDNDADVEIVVRGFVFDHEGNLLVEPPLGASAPAAAIADLDGDDDMEIMVGGYAYHHDGTEYYAHPEIPAFSSLGQGGYPQVADIDDDGLPEVVITGTGVAVVEHDGTLTASSLHDDSVFWRPAAIHDLDGDGRVEFLAGNDTTYSSFDDDLSLTWTVPVVDGSGYSTGTSFDFLGDGNAEAMYADQQSLYIYGDDGSVLLSAVRTSWTSIEYPVVADVDNDGSAEIVVVSNRGYGGKPFGPAVQVIRDAEDRWVPARRIWNQHGYHVTNVREDGTIPQVESKHWESFNTYRTQAQIDAGGAACRPEG